MTGALALTAALMGLAATPHCATMCAGACASLCAAASPRAALDCTPVPWAVGPVLLGRLVGYAGAGALAAAAYEGLHGLGDAVDWARPFWHIAQGLLLVLGLLLLWRGGFPVTWVIRAEALHRTWRSQSGRTLPTRPSAGRRVSVALLWPLLPCGALHAALLVAALASTPLEGAFVMGVFGTTSSLGLLLGERLWSTLRDHLVGNAARKLPWPDTAPLRLAGAALAASVTWGWVGARWFPVLQAWCA